MKHLIPDIFVHVANVLFLISYLVKRIFLLRFLTVLAGLILFPYYFLVEGGPLTIPIIWSIIFTAINVYQLIVLFRERRPVKLSTEEHELYELSFDQFSTKQFKSLLEISERKSFESKSVLTELGKPTHHVILIANGNAQDLSGTSLEKGSLIGAVNLATGRTSDTTITSKEPTEAIIWNNENLTQLLNKDKALKTVWQGMVSNLLINKA